MIVLGIETSCDETAVGIVEDGRRLLANAVVSSMDLHAAFGGVVPEVAARSHIEVMTPVIKDALATAFPDDSEEKAWEKIDAIAVANGPGLGGSLLIGVTAAKSLAVSKKKPLYAVNHVIGHVYANFLTQGTGAALPAAEASSTGRKASLDDTALPAPLLSHGSSTTASSDAHSRLVSPQSPALATTQRWRVGDEMYELPESQPTFPFLALTVAGGHSQMTLFKDWFDYKVLGRTRDDAIGEAFDKVAKILGLPYPGGPSIAKKALEGDAYMYKLPKAKLDDPYEWSFSGLKTAVLRLAQKEVGEDFTFPSYKLPNVLSGPQKADIAASFQRIAIETIVDKVVNAFEEFQPTMVVVGGGVAASQELRMQLRSRIEDRGSESATPLQITDIKLCTDNGAMIAALGCFHAINNMEKADPYSLSIDPNLSM